MIANSASSWLRPPVAVRGWLRLPAAVCGCLRPPAAVFVSSFLLTALASAAPAAQDPAWRRAEPGHAWTFPRDHFAHDDFKIEWWYLTGQLHDRARPERRFGYQFTFFRIGMSPLPASGASSFAANSWIMGHAAVTLLDRGEHRFSDVLWRAAPITGGFSSFAPAKHGTQEIARCPAPFGSDGEWSLAWNGDAFDFAARDARPGGFAFALSTKPDRPLVLQGEGGLSRKSRDGSAASLYYSFTRLRTVGSLEIDGDLWEVDGESWMDHEISSDQLAASQVGWDWFSIRLDDGRDLMLYRLRGSNPDGDFARGTVVLRDGTARVLDAAAWRATPGRKWTSAANGAEYPVEWEIEIPGESLQLAVVPLCDSTENVAQRVPDLRYWEGPIEVRDPFGATVGSGYLELTGYGKDAKLPL